MNEWIYSTDNFSNQALVNFKIQSSQTLTIVVFSINWSRMFVLYVRRMCCKLELKTLNNRKMTASLRKHRKRRVCSDPCIFALHSNTLLFFQWSFAWNLNISPIIWYCNIRRPYKISNILYKTKEKAVSFIDIWNVEWPFLSAFIFLAAWRVFVWRHRKVCCSLSQWCDVGTVVWCRTCTLRFFRSFLRLFSRFPPIWVCEMKVLWKVASSHAKDLKSVFYTWPSTAWRISLQGNIL